MTPDELVDVAQELIGAPNRQLGNTRLLAAALLLRQALEAAIDQFWLGVVPGMTGVSGRAQLVSLPFYVDTPLARDVVYAWYRLSSACHHDAYELPPAPEELVATATIIRRFAAVRTDSRP